LIYPCEPLTIAPMKATRINHVSIHADDMDESIGFYERLFGAERLPTPNFGMPVQWLRVGDQQLHVFAREDTPAPIFHHLAFDVDDFGAVYRRAKELGLLDGDTNGAPIRSHPSGWVQMYIRDPAGNLVEIDCPDVAALDDELRAAIPDIESQDLPQAGEARHATLYHEQARDPVSDGD